MAEVIKFYKKNAAEDPDAVLEQAIGNYSSVLVLGWSKDNNLDVRSSLDLDASNILWLIELFKTKLMKGDYFLD